ncbi:MAG: rod shape-determining protein MreD [Comamonadaceae bacterium BICA1-1]|nr:MAG: rod shape-determining protein MreD [Comamonadaceae bacterium BICA1-1]
MIMRAGQALLLPANPAFIWGTLMGVLLFEMVLQMALLGRAAWAPDLLALTLVFWTVHQPRRIGVGVAFGLGLLVDVHQGALLGQHALAYSVMCFLAVLIHRRLLWFDWKRQTLHVLLLFVLVHALQWLVRALAGDGGPDLWMALAPLGQAALWPLATVLLLAPQRRAHDPDDDRPL